MQLICNIPCIFEVPDQQPRQRSRMRRYTPFRRKPRRQFGHGDVTIRFHPANQRSNMRRKPATACRAALPGRRQRSCCRLALRQTNGRTWRNTKPPSRRTATLTTLYLLANPNPKIRRAASAHDAPLKQGESQKSAQGNPQRFRFQARCSKPLEDRFKRRAACRI